MSINISERSPSRAAHIRIELPGLLAMRCYAAMAIVLFHLVALAPLRTPNYLSFVSTHFGFGVPLFYTVSAFGLFVGYGDRINTRGELREFYLRRFLRIAPLFYFMMIFYYPFFFALGGSPFTLSQFVSSGLFIFNFLPEHVTGYVMASWSIGVEMAFYFIFPLLVFSVTSLRRSLVCFAIAIFMGANWALAFQGAGATLRQFSQLSLMAHLGYFAAGITAYFVWLKLRSGRKATGQMIFAASLLAIIGLVGFADRIHESLGTMSVLSNGSATQTLWAVALAGGVLGVSLHPQRWFVNSTATLLGTASFSIYLWHPVVIVVLSRLGLYHWIYSSFNNAVLIPFALSTAATLAVLVPLSLLSYRYIERPGMALRSQIGRWSPAQ